MNKIQEVVQKLRSVSESDKGSSSVSSVSGEEACLPSVTERDTVWVTDASQPMTSEPYLGVASNVMSYLSDLSTSHARASSIGSTSATEDGCLDVSNVSSSHPTSTSTASSPAPMSAQVMQKTVYDSLMESSGSSDVSSMTSGAGSSHERKGSKSKRPPKGTLEYKVKDGDTLNRIGVYFDVTPSELIKINKLHSRTVFEGQKMFVPDPNYIADLVAASPLNPLSNPPGEDARPKVDVPLANLGDRSPPSVPGHVVQVATSPILKPSGPSRQQSENSNADLDKECLQKFVKICARRILEEEEDEKASIGGVTCRGTLLVTPNAIMFDPDVNDPFVIQNGGQTKYSTVVYIENVKSVALYHDLSPRVFWKQPKEIRCQSPRPEPYKPEESNVTDSENAFEGTASDVRQDPDGICVPPEDSLLKRHSPEGGNEQLPTDPVKNYAGHARHMSDELENMNELSQKLPVSVPQPGRTSEEVEHMMTSHRDMSSNDSHLQQQMSRSSELAGSEIALFDDVSKEIGAARDFGPHMGRSSSEMSRQGLPSGVAYISSPRESTNSGLSLDRSDSTNDNLNTPTQGFAPVFFTDRSPGSLIAAPKPVSGQKNVLHLSELGSLSEDAQSSEKRLSGDGNSAGQCHTRVGGAENMATSKLPNSQNEMKSETSVSDERTADKNNLTTETSSVLRPNETCAQSSLTNKVTDDLQSMGLGNEGMECKQDLPSDSADGRIPPGGIMDGSSKSSMSSPLSSFSPLRTPAQHISSFFSYTTGFFRASDKERGVGGVGSPEATSTPAAEDSPLNKLSKNLSSFQFPSSLIPGAFSQSSSTPAAAAAASSSTSNSTANMPALAVPSRSFNETSIFSNSTDSKLKEELSEIFGPPLSSYLPRSDSPHFVESPMYLQIRTGVPKDQDPDVPKRHAIVRKVSGKLMEEEYWFVIPRDMTDKLYRFLIDWQPDAYGDQEDCQGRERYFYNPKDMNKSDQAEATDSELVICDDYYSLMSWEIIGHPSQEIEELIEEAMTDEEDETDNNAADEITLPEFINGPSIILTEDHVLKLMQAMPRNMSVGYNWALVFSTTRHGFSLQQLYREMKQFDSECPVILCIRDTENNVFGAYLSNGIRVSEGFYGSGSTFLFTFYPEFQHFHWQGDNIYFMNGEINSFAIGSGTGYFGLWLDGDLDKGRSHTCKTFGNAILSSREDFNIINIEVWQLADTTG